YTILEATKAHLPFLHDIEEAAAVLFPLDTLTEPLRSMSQSPEDFATAHQRRLLWIAVDESNAPVAFLIAKVVDDQFHVNEFDVHPEHGKQGLGSRLLQHVLTEAKRRGYRSATLTTFAHLSWNAPFYAKQGFKVLSADELGVELASIVRHEAAIG